MLVISKQNACYKRILLKMATSIICNSVRKRMEMGSYIGNNKRGEGVL